MDSAALQAVADAARDDFAQAFAPLRHSLETGDLAESIARRIARALGLPKRRSARWSPPPYMRISERRRGGWTPRSEAVHHWHRRAKADENSVAAP